MSRGFDDVKKVIMLRQDAKNACTFRTVAAIVIGPSICTAIYMMLESMVNISAGNKGAIDFIQTIWKYAGLPIVILAVILYIYRTSIRKWSYSFMLDYQEQLEANGYTKCPRCGNAVVPQTGHYTYSEHTSDTVTTTRWSDGSVTTSRSPNYTRRTTSYRYYQCSNASCGILAGHRSLGKVRYRGMPATKKGARALILGQGTVNYRKMKPASRLISSKSIGFTVAAALIIFGVVRIIQFNSLENRGDKILFDAQEVSAEVGTTALEGIKKDSALDSYTITIHPNVSMLSYIFMQGKPCTIMKQKTDGVVTYYFDFMDYDAETGLQLSMYLVKKDGMKRIYDKRTDAYYDEGTKAYNAIYPLLDSLTYNSLVNKKLFKRTDKQIIEQRYTQDGDSYGFDCDYNAGDVPYSFYEWLVIDEGRAVYVKRNTPEDEDFRCCFFDYGTPSMKPVDEADYKEMKKLPDWY